MRFFARYIDIYAFGLIVGIASALFYPLLLSTNNIANGLIILFLWFIFEPIVLSSCGTTLGKFLLNIKLTDLNGNKLRIFDAYKRSFGVWLVGLGFGIPIVSLFTLISAHSRLKRTGTTYWDENNFIVTHRNIRLLKAIVALLIGILFFASSIYENTQKYYPSSNNYAEEIGKENKKLPIMLDSETELYSMNFNNNTLTYQYRLVNIDIENVNKDMLYNYLRNKILKRACDKSNPNPTLTLGYSLSFTYCDKNKKPIFNINIKPSDCNIKNQ